MHFGGSVFKGIDSICEYFSIPQIAVDIVFLNLLRRQEDGAKQKAKNNDRPKITPVFGMPAYKKPGQAIKHAEGKIYGEISEDRSF